MNQSMIGRWRADQLVVAAVMSIGVLMTSGCLSSMTVSSHVQSGLDMSQYRTFDWGVPDALPTGDPRLDRDPYFQDALQGAIQKQLGSNGFELSTSGTPDLLIHYHASVTQRIDPNLIDRTYGYCLADDCPPDGSQYEAGTIVLDIMDSRTNRLLWRGWAQDSMSGMLDPNHMDEKIDEAVRRMLARLPKR